jgi:8-oxo-dGTP pyrophosphatase MutT (NUDIX family)
VGGEAPWAERTLHDRPFTVADIRERFGAVAVERAVSDRLAPTGSESIAAAVLVAAFDGPDGARIVFTKRPDTMPNHRGEISFPGGKHDPSVDRSLIDTALRESHEEIALDPNLVEIVGVLDSIGTIASKFMITPIVGVVAEPPALVAHPREVVSVFDVGVDELLDDSTFRAEQWMIGGDYRDMYFYEIEGETIWGATARILTEFLAFITATH